jgi:polyisoprenoid-binding protein YceI
MINNKDTDMISRRILLSLALVAGLQSGFAAAAPAQTGAYTIDPAHSFVQFGISHLGYSHLVGRFDKVSGTFTVSPNGNTVEGVVPVSSIDTNHAQRDKDLLAPQFFDVAKFPTMSFSGKQVGNNLIGRLTLHGVTRPVTFHLHAIGAGKDPWGGYRSGYEATTVLKRSDYGMATMLGPIGNEVDVRLNIEGTLNKK